MGFSQKVKHLEDRMTPLVWLALPSLPHDAAEVLFLHRSCMQIELMCKLPSKVKLYLF